MAEEYTFQADELNGPTGGFEPAEFSFSAKELAPAPKAQNTEMEHFKIAQKALSQSPQWKSADATQKKRLMGNLQDTVIGGGYTQAQQKSEYEPESFAKGLGRKAIRYTGATIGGVAGGLAAAPTVIGVGPGATAGAMAGYGVGKATEEALLGQEPAPPAKERVFKGGTLRQGLAEAIYNVPESVGNLAEGAIAFPSALGKAAMTKGGGKQVIEDTAHMFGAPLGLYGADAAKDAWVLDPAGAALAPTMIAGGLRGLKGKGMAEPKLDQYIAKKYPNAVGMTSAEMRRSPDIQKHLADAQEAIKTITALKDEGAIKVGEQGAEQVRLPKNRMEFSDAISQAKDHVFNVYNTLKQKAGEQGVTIDSTGLQSQLKAIGDDAGLRVMRPEIIKTATDLADRFAQEGPLTPDAATSIIKSANDSYKAFLRNPSAETGGKAVLDAMVANNLRKAMETSIDSEVGPGWQAYRNKYKQLSTIEKEVTKGAVVDARKSPIGLLDFTDMFSAGEAVSGIISMNPAQFAKGGTMFMIKRIYRKLKDPNAGVEKMFKMTDKQYKRPDKMSTEPWIPAGPPEPAPLDMSFNPETVPGRQSSAMTEIPGNTAKGLEEGGYRFENPYPIKREQTIANPEQLPGTSYRQETIDPNAVQVITRQKTVENPEQLPGRQSSYTDQEMVPQGNTNVDLMSMTTKLKEFGYTPEEIQQFIPKAMKAGVPIAAVTAYLVADEETKKQMRTTMPMLGMIYPFKGKKGELKSQFTDLVDKQVKFEIPDSSFSLKVPIAKMKGTRMLHNVVDSPYFFENVPNADKIKFKFIDKGSSYFDTDTNTIAINTNNTPSKIKATILHEMQHYVQDNSNFSTGSNPVTSGMHAYKFKGGEDEAIRVAKHYETNDYSDPFGGGINDVSKILNKDTDPVTFTKNDAERLQAVVTKSQELHNQNMQDPYAAELYKKHNKMIYQGKEMTPQELIDYKKYWEESDNLAIEESHLRDKKNHERYVKENNKGLSTARK